MSVLHRQHNKCNTFVTLLTIFCLCYKHNSHTHTFKIIKTQKQNFFKAQNWYAVLPNISLFFLIILGSNHWGSIIFCILFTYNNSFLSFQENEISRLWGGLVCSSPQAGSTLNKVPRSGSLSDVQTRVCPMCPAFFSSKKTYTFLVFPKPSLKNTEFDFCLWMWGMQAKHRIICSVRKYLLDSKSFAAS